MKKLLSTLTLFLALFSITILAACGNSEAKKQAPVFSNIPEDVIIQYETDLDLLSLGLTANDNLDGDVTANITVNITDTTQLFLGQYDVIYSVTDSDGNVGTEIIIITVQITSNGIVYSLINDDEIEITDYSVNAPQNVLIPNSVLNFPITSIGDYAFSGFGLKSVVFGNNITTIGKGAFSINDLSSVTIPNGVTKIGEDAFRSNLITTVTIPNSVISIGNNAFYGNLLTSVTIPDSVISIKEGAFRYNELTSVTIGNNVTTIGYSAFYYNELTSIIIPESVTAIGYGAFQGNFFTSIIIMGDETRFNDIWLDIGFPELLMP